MRVLVTRRWPAEVERALQDRFEVVLNAADRPLGQADLAQAMGEFDVLCPTVSDRIDACVIDGGDRVRLIANYGAVYSAGLTPEPGTLLLLGLGGLGLLRRRA